MTRGPTDAAVIGAALEARLVDVNVAIPGRVVRYDPKLQQADVQPLIKGYATTEEEDQVSESLPVIPNVPCIHPGAGGMRITFPVQAGDDGTGDVVLLVFSQASLDKWLAQGGEVDPNDDRKHHIADAVAILGLRDFAHSLASVDSSYCTIGKDGASFQPVALGDNVESRLAKLEANSNLVQTHTHVVSGTAAAVSTDLIPPAAPTFTITDPPTVKSSTVKVSE